MKTVLHITAHMGGGLGKVMMALIDEFIDTGSRYKHRIVSLEYINGRCLRWADRRGIEYRQEVSPVSPALHQMVCEADIVHLHFWHHLAVYHFMRSFSGQSARLVIWSHVNGHHAPYKFSPAILCFPELFILSTPYSLKAPDIRALPAQYRTDHIGGIFTTAGIKGFRDVRPVPHKGFNVGYVGWVDYAKMHPDFLTLCAMIDIPDVKFIVCGGKKHLEIRQKAIDWGMGHLFDFRGHVNDVSEVLAEFDVFGYPLTPHHFGTGEQVLIEAMAAGVPQVVLDNGPEGYVVKNGETGIVAPSLPAYVDAIKALYYGGGIRNRFSDRSREYAELHYSIEPAAREWIEVYDELWTRGKKPCVFEGEGIWSPR